MTSVKQYQRGSLPTGRQRAFTLIEILMVVVIMGIAAACVVPQLSSRDDLKASAAARVVMADLIYAQNNAIATQQYQYVAFDIAHKKYSILKQWSPQVFVTNPITKNDYVTTFSTAATNAMQDMSLVSANFDSQAGLAFDSLGAPYSVSSDGTATALISQGSIVVQAGSDTLTITVEPYTGEINVQ